jgi:hypothetical protein
MLRVMPMPTFQLAAFESFASPGPAYGCRVAEESRVEFPRAESPAVARMDAGTPPATGIAGLLRLFSGLL